MRETRFINRNKDKWAEYEFLLNNKHSSAEELQDMYVQITDDLSYARTFYVNRSVRVYLNFLAQKIFSTLYKTKKSPAGRFVSFWKTDLPQLVWESRWEFLLSLGVFLLTVFVGVLSTMIDIEFPRMIMGDDYVDMTLANIDKNDPMAVYKQGGAFGGTLGITANNIFVALLTFISGILAGIGSIFFLLRTGIMVGCFQYFFVVKGFGMESILAIWLHGTLELSAIVIAGAAGLTMGKGIVFPDTYRRMQSFQRSARRGFEIMVGTVPLFIVAGFVEGTFTRYTDAPAIVRGGFILLCAGFVLFYFAWYPYYLSKKGFASPLKEGIVPPDNLEKIHFQEIRSVGEIFSDTFIFFRKMLATMLIVSLLLTTLYMLIAYFCYPAFVTSEISSEDNNGLLDFWSSGKNYGFFIGNPIFPYQWLLNTLFLSIFTSIIVFFIKKTDNAAAAFHWRSFFITLLCSVPALLFFQVMMYMELGGFLLFMLLASIGFFLLWLWSSVEQRNPFGAIVTAFSLLIHRFGFVAGASILTLFVGFIFYMLFFGFLSYIISDFILTNLSLDLMQTLTAKILIEHFFTLFMLFIHYGMLLITTAFLYFSLIEMEYAGDLLAKIELISLKRQVKGIERE